MKHCLICGKPAERCHIKSRGSGGGDEPWNIMPLDRIHHHEQHSIGIISFAEKYQEVMRYLESNGWYVEEINGRKRLARK